MFSHSTLYLTLVSNDMSKLNSYLGWKMGFEPTTPGATNQCSNQLSYIHHRFLLYYILSSYDRNHTASLSIVIPTYNNRKGIGKTLPDGINMVKDMTYFKV